MSTLFQHELPPDHREREELVTVFDRNFLVEASAGSGKTTVLVDRLVRMIALGQTKVGEIAALTFTRKAAGEMRSRLLVKLEKARHQADEARIRKRLAEALEHLHHAYVGTIHGFCARILREYSAEAGLPAGFEELGAEEASDLHQALWTEWVQFLNSSNDKQVSELQEAGLALEDLHHAFLKFSDYGDVDDWPTSHEPRTSIKGVREKLSEYHRHMAQLAAQLPADVDDKLMEKYRRLPRLAALVKWHEVAEVMAHLEEYQPRTTGFAKRKWPGGPKQCDQEMERWNHFCENVAMPLHHQWRIYRYPLVMEFLDRTHKHFRIRRHQLNQLTFQDLLMKAVELVRTQPMVRRQLHTQWKRLLVDEFQDTDPLQAELIFLISAEKTAKHWQEATPKPGSLLLVGDPKQSIYRFRRADIQVYQLVKNLLVRHGGTVLQLTANFRSEPALVEWVNTTFGSLFTEFESQVEYTPMEAGRAGNRTIGESLRYLEFPKDVAGRFRQEVVENEAEAIARWIQEALESKLKLHRTDAEKARGVSDDATADDFMILTSQMEHLQAYGNMLTRWGIRNQISGGAQLNTYPGLRLIQLLLQSVSQPENTTALVGLLRSELCGLSDAQLYAYRHAGGTFQWSVDEPFTVPHAAIVNSFFAQMRQFASDMGRMPVVGALERILDRLGLPAWSTEEATGPGCLAKALMLLRDTERQDGSLHGIIDRIARLMNRQPRRDGLYYPSQAGVGVRIMNLHKAKGLEAHVVILADCMGDHATPRDAELHVSRTGDTTEGQLHAQAPFGQYAMKSLAYPAQWAEYLKIENDIIQAEKQRLLYVAATRARDMLLVCYRTSSDETDANRSNPWKALIPHLNGAGRLEPDAARQPPERSAQQNQLTSLPDTIQSLETAWQACLTPNTKVHANHTSNSSGQKTPWPEMWQSYR